MHSNSLNLVLVDPPNTSFPQYRTFDERDSCLPFVAGGSTHLSTSSFVERRAQHHHQSGSLAVCLVSREASLPRRVGLVPEAPRPCALLPGDRFSPRLLACGERKHRVSVLTEHGDVCNRLQRSCPSSVLVTVFLHWHKIGMERARHACLDFPQSGASSHRQSSGSVSVDNRSFLHQAALHRQFGFMITSKITVSIRSVIALNEDSGEENSHAGD